MKWILAAAAVGFVLMFFFEAPLTRALGLLCLFGVIVGGVFLIADPDDLRRERSD